MPPFVGRRTRRSRSLFPQSLVDRWFGVYQWSAAGSVVVGRRASVAAEKAEAPTSSSRPTKRAASYSGHELSFSDVVADFDSDSEYWPDDDDDDDDDDNSFSQAAAARAEAKKAEDDLMTAVTGDPTCTTNTSSQQALPMPTLPRRMSAPPVLCLTVEIPLPAPPVLIVLPVLIGLPGETPSPPSSSESISLDGDSLHASTDESVDDDQANSEHNQSVDAAYAATPLLVSPDRSSVAPRPASSLSLPASPTSPASPRSATDHRSLRFNPRTRIRLHLHLNDYTDAEVAALYLSDVDTSRIRRDIVDSIVRMHADHLQEQGQDDVEESEEEVEEEEGRHCTRGLEAMATPTSASALRTARIRHTDAVLDEQDRQFLRGETDENRLAGASTGGAEDAVARAVVLGAADAVFVQQFVRPEDRSEAST